MNNGTILIVDDSELNIELLAESLGDKYNIMPATSGEAAMAMLERKKPDLALLDVHMPGATGFDVLRFMKEREELANIPVIFVTGEHDEYSEEKGLALGAADYVKKPYKPSIINVKVQNHLELKTYRDNLEQLVLERTRMLEKRTKQLASSREAVIMGMSLMAESHDKVTGEHIERIKKFVGVLACKMAEMYPDLVTPDLAGQIEMYSTLHDVGKVAIPDAVLRKTGIFTPEEFEIMKAHTMHGAELLRKTEGFLTNDGDNDLKVAIEIAECHHEKYDGTGYPHGLSGESIPVSARVVAVADVYDALRSQRPYKKTFTHGESVNIIIGSNGEDGKKHFDPKVLEAFNALRDEFDRIYW